MNTDPENEDELGTPNRLTQTQKSASEIRGQASSMAENISEKASSVLGAAKEKFGTMSESARSAASSARDRAGELFGDARETATEAYEQARQRMATLSEDGMQYVRENPAKSVMTALLAGVILGFTLRRP